MAPIRDIAEYLLQLSSREAEPTLITQMHLHKLLYYVQAWSLAMRGEPMFPAVIEAWTHGPVVRAAYPMFADYRNDPIPVPERQIELSAEDRSFVESVWEGYKGYSASKLREMTHQERPWRLARGDLGPDDRSDSEISQQEMRQFFRSQYAGQAIPGLEPEALAAAEVEFSTGGGVPLEQLFGE